MKQITLILLAVLMLQLQCLFSQSKMLENVVEVELKSSIAITNNKQIVGYAVFYKIDKMKKMARYRLEVLDENLKSIGNNEFEGSKDLQLKRPCTNRAICCWPFMMTMNWTGINIL